MQRKLKKNHYQEFSLNEAFQIQYTNQA